MKKFAKLMSVVLLVAMVFTLSSCGKTVTTDDVKAEGKFIIATNAEFEPFEYMDGTEYAGIDIEICQVISDKLGVELQVENMGFESVVASVKSGKVHMGASGLSITEERKKSVNFTDSYFSATQSIVVTKDSPIKSSADLEGKKLGSQIGTTGETYAQENYGDENVTSYNKFADAIQALLAGKIDAVVIDDFPATKFVESNPDELVKIEEPLTGEEYAFALSKNNEELLGFINDVLQEMKDSGELDAIISEYYSVD